MTSKNFRMTKPILIYSFIKETKNSFIPRSHKSKWYELVEKYSKTKDLTQEEIKFLEEVKEMTCTSYQAEKNRGPYRVHFPYTVRG